VSNQVERLRRERKKRPFAGIDDLHQRLPELRKDEMRKLAAVGALNFIQNPKSMSNVQCPMSKVQRLRSTTQPSNKRRGTLTWDVGPERYKSPDACGKLNESRGLPDRCMKDFRSWMGIPSGSHDFAGTNGCRLSRHGLTIGRHPVPVIARS